MNEAMKKDVLRIFEQLSRIPRESGNEKAVSNWIRTRAESLGLKVTQDDIWNLIITKPASEGCESRPPVMLQAHLDMVCEKNGDSSHDFSKDPILLKTEGDWLTSATGTTLGADNGIGVASAMAILESETVRHPPLEVIFTVQEETTFEGAKLVDISHTESLRLINLDHADEHELIVGSCGGTGVELTMPIKRLSHVPDDLSPFTVRLGGLKGGHSGEDIHRGRGNAILLLLRVLGKLQLPIADLRGGTNRLAIPREAEALVFSVSEDLLATSLKGLEQILRNELGDAGADLSLTCEPAKAIPPLDGTSQSSMEAMIRLYPNGIVEMNGSMEGIVESSDNIGILTLEEDHVKLVSEIRGGHTSSVEDIKSTIDTLAELFSARVKYFNDYIPWEYSTDSDLRRVAVETYSELFHEEMRPIALHAGLECGFFAIKKPGMDIVSIGPDCENFHSPKERVRISSVIRFYEFLTTLLGRL